MSDRENVIKDLEICAGNSCEGCTHYEPYSTDINCSDRLMMDAAKLLKGQEEQIKNRDKLLKNARAEIRWLIKEQEAIQPKTIPEELKQKMWNALYAEEDKFEEKYVGTIENDSWFFIYRTWLQKGFNLAIKAITDWEGR